MKSLTTLAVALILLFPVSSSAQQHSPDVTVRGAAMTQAQWAVLVDRKLSSALTYPGLMENEAVKSGIVSVRFHVDGNNQPVALAISRKSGSPRLDRAALRAIARMRTLPTMPATFGPDQPFVANIMFATSYDEYDRQVAQLRKEANRQRAVPQGTEALAFVITSHTGG